MRRRPNRSLAPLAIALSLAVFAPAPASTAAEIDKYPPLDFTQFCNPTPWGGVDTGYGEWWGSLSQEEQSRALNKQYTGARLKIELEAAFRQGTVRTAKPCRTTPGIDWAALDEKTGVDELGRKWSYGPQTCTITETMMCDTPGVFFDYATSQSAGDRVGSSCRSQTAQYLKVNPPTSKHSLFGWGSGSNTIYNNNIYACADVEPPPVAEIEPETDTVGIDVKVRMPTAPVYKRDGADLKKAHDDFVGKR